MAQPRRQARDSSTPLLSAPSECQDLMRPLLYHLTLQKRVDSSKRAHTQFFDDYLLPLWKEYDLDDPKNHPELYDDAVTARVAKKVFQQDVRNATRTKTWAKIWQMSPGFQSDMDKMYDKHPELRGVCGDEVEGVPEDAAPLSPSAVPDAPAGGDGIAANSLDGVAAPDQRRPKRALSARELFGQDIQDELSEIVEKSLLEDAVPAESQAQQRLLRRSQLLSSRWKDLGEDTRAVGLAEPSNRGQENLLEKARKIVQDATKLTATLVWVQMVSFDAQSGNVSVQSVDTTQMIPGVQGWETTVSHLNHLAALQQYSAPVICKLYKSNAVFKPPKKAKEKHAPRPEDRISDEDIRPYLVAREPGNQLADQLTVARPPAISGREEAASQGLSDQSTMYDDEVDELDITMSTPPLDLGSDQVTAHDDMHDDDDDDWTTGTTSPPPHTPAQPIRTPAHKATPALTPASARGSSSQAPQDHRQYRGNLFSPVLPPQGDRSTPRRESPDRAPLPTAPAPFVPPAPPGAAEDSSAVDQAHRRSDGAPTNSPLRLEADKEEQAVHPDSGHADEAHGVRGRSDDGSDCSSDDDSDCSKLSDGDEDHETGDQDGEYVPECQAEDGEDDVAGRGTKRPREAEQPAPNKKARATQSTAKGKAPAKAKGKAPAKAKGKAPAKAQAEVGPRRKNKRRATARRVKYGPMM
ncbi:hypothetical protein AURDEDRAFT_131913 [Auricularia subglabra TFB-10046 SS5]|uniref:Rrn9 domain-containing protein n=1 Tax=Auricularia subglabra (strain TFB-10046 / SS5) TaxID=717982 RepID=J0CRV8_AURST|nr:hypothetical protein AURDEDRAFT_131913 [Auricularia subglabra TFB-10046 SS5]